MSHPLLQPFLERAGVVVLDGGLATELERRGADLRDPLWSAKVLLENPALIRQVHLDYFHAGADVVTSASYQATLSAFLQRGLTMQQAEDLLRLSVRLAQEARTLFWDSEPANRVFPLVATSVGCYGAFLHDGSEYRGDYGLSVRELMDWHRPRLAVFATSGADLLACETIPSLLEAEALVRLLEELPSVPAWLSFSCQDERRLCDGTPLAQAVALACACPSVLAVGVNCTPPRFILGLLQSVSADATKPLLAYPNSGETWDQRRWSWVASRDVIDWSEAARNWRQEGARLIGGCCRTTPVTIRTIKQSLSAGKF